MDRQKFVQLLQNYLDGTCTPEEKQTIDYWYELINQEAEEKAPPVPKADLEAALWEKIQAGIQQNPPQWEPKRQPFWWKELSRTWMAAASVLFLLGLSFLVYLYVKMGSGETLTAAAVGQLKTQKNTGTAATWLTLEDSSRIQLQPGSSIRFPDNFGPDKRVVYLEGNALFEVTKDMKRPFLVFSGDIVTRVVGTSFTIHSDNSNLEVTVLSGKVIVEKAQPSTTDPKLSEGVLLTPNQKVTYYSGRNYFVTGLVQDPMPLTQARSGRSIEDDFRFGDTPLTEVLERIEKAYGLNIVLANEEITHCPITADLSQQTLHTKLNIICATLQASYEIKGTSIIVNGGNCE